jgi:hypothetical protein
MSRENRRHTNAESSTENNQNPAVNTHTLRELTVEIEACPVVCSSAKHEKKRGDEDVVPFECPRGPLSRAGENEIFQPTCLIHASNVIFENHEFTLDHFVHGAMRKSHQEGFLHPLGTTSKHFVGTIESAKHAYIQCVGAPKLTKMKGLGRSKQAKIQNILKRPNGGKRMLVTGIINGRIFEVESGARCHCCAIVGNEVIDVNLGRRPISSDILNEIFQDISVVYLMD